MKIILYFILTVLIFFSVSPVSEAEDLYSDLSSEYEPTFDDWVDMPASVSVCHGYYQEAPPPPVFPCEPGEPEPIRITSLQGSFQENAPSTLTGNVHLIQGTRQMFADKAIIYRNRETGKIETIEAIGHVKLLQPGLRLEGSDATFFQGSDTKIIRNAYYRLYQRHARGQACSITAIGQDKLILKDASYTTCPPQNNTWMLRASRINLNKQTGRGQAYHTRMLIKDIPVFYLPYLNFPIDDRRKTGFLFPIFGTSNQSGTEIATPFYVNLAPNYDATLTPRYYSRRGVNLEAQFRYMDERSRGQIQASVLPNDRLYARFRQQYLNYHPGIPNNDPRVTALQKGNNSRRAILAKHTTSFNKHLVGDLDFQAVGDSNYFMDFGNTLNNTNLTQLLQRASLNYREKHTSALLNVQKYQTLHPFKGPITSPPYERLPQFAFVNYYPDVGNCFFFLNNGDFTHFYNRTDPLTGFAVTTGDRFHMRPSLSRPFITPCSFFKPRLQYDILSYSLHLGNIDFGLNKPTTPSRLIPMFDIDSGLIFEREFCAFNSSIVQTLEPRAFYLYVPYRDQNAFPIFDTSQSGFDYNLLYRTNRFNGLDRVGDTNQLTLSLTSRFLNARTGAEYINLTLGEILYFKKRLVTACNSALYPYCLQQEIPDYNKGRSPLVGLARYFIQDTLTLNALIEWDTYGKQLNKRSLWFQYKPDDLNVLNLGYQFLRRNPSPLNNTNVLIAPPAKLEQSDLSFAWQLSPQWRMLGRWHYDLRRGRTTDILAGIEQEGCCTAIRFSFVRFRFPNPGELQRVSMVDFKKNKDVFFIQFVFKGLGAVGHNRLGGTMSAAIPGYQWRDDKF